MNLKLEFLRADVAGTWDKADCMGQSWVGHHSEETIREAALYCYVLRILLYEDYSDWTIMVLLYVVS